MARSVRLVSTMALCLAALPTVALAQFNDGSTKPGTTTTTTAQKSGNPFTDGGPTVKAWAEFKLDAKKKIQLNFKNAGVDSVLQLFMDQSGITIVHDPAFKDPLTVISAGKVTLDRAFDILNTVIGLKGYTLTKDDDMLVIRQKDNGQGGFGQNGNPLSGLGFPTNPGDPNPFQPDQTILDTYVIKYANATDIARVINDVFSATPGQQNNPFANFFNNNNQRGGPGNRNNRGGGAAAITIGPGGLQFGQQASQPVKASSDDFSNSVIVNATARDQIQVKKIITEIDKDTTTPIQPKVFKLVFANANDLAPIVQNVLTTNPPKGRGGQGNTQPNFGQQIGTALRFGNAAASFGNVVADARTNSLVVSTTLENLALVDQVIKDLDKPTQVIDNTIVFQLQNAKADVVAQLLQAAFGNRQGASGTGATALQTGARTTTVTPNVNTTSTGGGGAGGGARPAGADDLSSGDNQNLALSQDQQFLNLALQDPNATAGDLLTSVAVSQGFGGGGQRGGGGGGLGGLFGGSQSSTTSTPLGQDSQQHLIGVRDLTGQVTVIPDTNTNSIIIVAPPSAQDLLKKILDQLDRIPQQVLVEVTIVEATLTKQTQFGFEATLKQLGVFGDPSKTGQLQQTFGLQNATTPPTGWNYTLTGGDLTAFFNALEADTKFDVLATPQIFTTNNVQGQINISQSIPYVLSTIQDATTGSLSYNYAFENVGIVLTVTPRIMNNGYLDLSLDQTANDLQGYTSFNAPIVNQRETTTEVQVKDGTTIVLGGIIQNQITATVNKVPLLGDIPILGNLFKSTNKSNTKTELMVLLTPHIIKDAADAEKYKKLAEQQLTPRTQKTVHDIEKSGGSVFGDGGGTKSTQQTPPPPPPTSDSQKRSTGN